MSELYKLFNQVAGALNKTGWGKIVVPSGLTIEDANIEQMPSNMAIRGIGSFTNCDRLTKICTTLKTDLDLYVETCENLETVADYLTIVGNGFIRNNKNLRSLGKVVFVHKDLYLFGNDKLIIDDKTRISVTGDVHTDRQDIARAFGPHNTGGRVIVKKSGAGLINPHTLDVR